MFKGYHCPLAFCRTGPEAEGHLLALHPCLRISLSLFRPVLTGTRVKLGFFAVLSLLSLTHVLSGLSLSFCRSIWKASLCRSYISSVNQFLSLQENAVAVRPGYCLNRLWSQHQPRDAPPGKSGGTFLEKQREDPQRVGSTFRQGPGHKEI